MRSFKANSGDKQNFQSGNYTGLRLVTLIKHLAANTAFAGVVTDWFKINVKLTLVRDGKRHTVFSENVLPLALATNFDNGIFDEVKGGGTPFLRKTLAAAAGVNETLAIAAEIHLPCIINLSKGDELVVELKALDCFPVATVDTGVSTIQWELIEGVGNALGIPFVDVEMVTAGQSSSDFEFGNGVKAVYFINNDKFTNLAVDQVLDTVEFHSDKKSTSDEWAELVISRSRDFSSATLADQRNQSFCIVDVEKDSMCYVPGDATDDVQHHGVHIKLNMIPTNVNNAKNYLVATGIKAHTDTAVRGMARDEKHKKENAAQVVG